MQIADVFARLVLDDKEAQRQLQQDLPAAAEKAGTQSGKRFGTTLGTAAKVTLGGMAGLVSGALFGMATQGAVELNTAVQAFAAETGATQAEIESAQGSIADLYKTNLQSFGEIGDTLAGLRTQMGLTQDEAESLGDAFLTFATATRQDASDAVQSFDDILDSWGLSASDAAGIMDVLVKSHQEYGGTVADNQRTLAALAPAMKAANMDIGDGVAILNLFGAKGLDAQMASAAFAKALTKVKSPKELQDLIADISATTDPFERAQKAADLFGARAGAKLANALSGANLEDYRVSIEEAAGASAEAAEAIEGSFGNQAQMVLRQFGGTLAEVGTNFGPLLLGFTSLLPMAGPIFAAAGTALGGLLAAAIPIGMAALPLIIIGAVVAAIALLVLNEDIRNAVFGFIGGVLEWTTDALAALAGILGEAFGAAFTAISDLLGDIGEVIGQAVDLWVNYVLLFPVRVAEAFVALLGMVAGFAQEAAPVVAGWVGTVVGAILSIPGKVVSWVASLVGQAARLGVQLGAAVRTLVGNVVGFFLGIPARIAGIGGSIVSGIINGMAGLPGRLIDTVARAFRSIRLDIGPFHISASGVSIDLPKIELPSFQAGTMFAPEGLAYLHRGEIVVPPAEAAAIRSGEAALGAPGGVAVPGEGRGEGITVNVYNPSPEPTSTSTVRELRKLAYMGVLA